MAKPKLKNRITAAALLSHPWLRNNREVRLETRKLKRYVVKKRWLKAFNTIVAIRRLESGIKLFDRRSSNESDVAPEQNASIIATEKTPKKAKPIRKKKELNFSEKIQQENVKKGGAAAGFGKSGKMAQSEVTGSRGGLIQTC